MELTNPVTDVKGIGVEAAKKLQLLGIVTITGLLDYLPRRYEDYSQIIAVRDTLPGPITIKAVVRSATGRYVRRGMHITEASISDDTGSMRAVWFNQPYRANSLKPGGEYYFSGLYELSRQRMQLMSPSVELVSDFPISTARIVPIYRETKGMTSKQIRGFIRSCKGLINTLPETLPAWLITKHGLLSRSQAILAMHFPETTEQLEAAKRRLGFEEVFELSLASYLNKLDVAQDKTVQISFRENVVKTFVSALPFSLTNAQRKTAWQIYKDMESSQPMNRLVEGDVGSGKTVVATMAALSVIDAGYQVALMAPTELLARQHSDTIYRLLAPLARQNEVALLVGSLTAAQKTSAQTAVKSGAARFIVGTQALIQDKVAMHSLGLVIVDEQHRFGVAQRKTLMAKAGIMPHFLSLTATPIPRSLALTLYGELDVSILDEKPAGRQPIQTEIVSPNTVEPMYQKVRDEVAAGRQAFVICPLIAESSTIEAHSAEKIYKQFSTKDFKGLRVGLLHGKLKADEKNAVMQQFVDHALDIIVSTTVIEVGVDVPNASVMVIESAERFGLAQLHQLRGRVGRGTQASYCYLVMSDSSAPPRRLRALETSQDGFKLAELDLELRGPGAIYGAMQHGALDLRVAKLTDTKLIALARDSAHEFVEHGEDLLHYVELSQRVAKLRTVTNLN